MNAPVCGSLFSGIGLLDIGLHLAGWEHRWLCESDEWRRGMLRKRFPGAVVHDDVRTLRGAAAAGAAQPRMRNMQRRRSTNRGAAGAAEPVTLIAGGFPCKGASTAGKREGFEHAETVLWAEMRRIVGEVGPRYVLVENVANILGMAAAPGEPPGSLWGTVLADLATLGFDVVWDCVPAAAVGAPHLRDRVFAVASLAAPERRPAAERAVQRTQLAPISGAGGAIATSHPNGARRPVGWQPERASDERARHVADEGHPAAAADAEERRSPTGGLPEREATQRPSSGVRGDDAERDGAGVAVGWGDYRPAIDRWAAIHGAAPEPLVRRLDDGDAKLQRVRARVDRSRLSALGDGVHVYVGWLVGEYVMGLERERPAVAA